MLVLNTQENRNSTDSYFDWHIFKVQDATRKLIVKFRAYTKTKEAGSNPNTTPLAERKFRVNILHDCGMY